MDKIILIDDDDFVVRAISSMLESVEYVVESYPDAGPALEQCDFAAADLIITDLEMPTEQVLFLVETR
jgi:CheY-like chemotaxis protein